MPSRGPLATAVAVALLAGFALLAAGLAAYHVWRRKNENRAPMKARLLGAACEVCTNRVATEGRWSRSEERNVVMCEWCARRYDKANRKAKRKMAIPRSRPPKGGNRAA